MNYLEFANIPARYLLRAIQMNRGSFVYSFAMAGAIYASLCFTGIALFVIIGSKIFFQWNESFLIPLIHWATIGGLHGYAWGVAVAIKAPSNIKYAEEKGIETWKGVGGAGLTFGIVVGLFTPFLSVGLEIPALLKIIPLDVEVIMMPFIIISILCGFMMIFIGQNASQIAYRGFVQTFLSDSRHH